MHTSTVLTSDGVTFAGAGGRTATFDDFCPGYRDNDRLAIVSPCLEDGVLGAGAAVLALAAAFYDAQRARGGEFFIYPQHFAIFDADEHRIRTRAGRRELPRPSRYEAWSNLDVWPDSQWIDTAGDARAMLAAALDAGANRLMWPVALEHAPIGEALRTRAAARLQWVALYGDVPSPTHVLSVDDAYAKMLVASEAMLPDREAASPTQQRHAYRVTSAADWLE